MQNGVIMKILMFFMCGIIVMSIASALDITTQDGTVYRNVKLKMAGDEEVKVTHAEGENIVKLDAIKPFDLKTADGRILQGTQLNGIRKNSVVIEYENAVRSLKAEQLPQEIRDVFGFTITKPEAKKSLNNENSDKTSNGTAEISGSKDTGKSKPINPIYAAGKTFLEKLKQAPLASVSSGYGVTPQNIQKSIVFIRGGDGAGSGFICSIHGIPVIITNAHVYAKLPNPTICDSDRHVYTAKSALVSKTRDLAIIEIDLPVGVIPLEIEPKVTDLPLNSRLTAYGDSLAGGVVTESKGILQGTGPRDIEISAGIVPGNSGGPVVGENMRVIGVSTYLKLFIPEKIFDGTRFGNRDDVQEESSDNEDNQQKESSGNKYNRQKKSSGNKYNRQRESSARSIRRFATRVDNMELDDFEVIDPELKQKDLDTYKALQEANNSMLENKSGYKNVFEKKMFFMKAYFPLNIVWDYHCSLLYLDGDFKKEIEKSRIISVWAGVPINNTSSQGRTQAENAFSSMQSYRKEQFGCPRCHGTGSVQDTSKQPAGRSVKFNDNIFGTQREYGDSNYSSRSSYNEDNYVATRTCDFCHGNPKRNFIVYNIHSSFLIGTVKPSSQKFSGLYLGCSEQVAEALLKPLGEPLKVEFNGIIAIWQYNSNNIFSEAKTTQLFFVAGRLESITIIFDHNQATWKQLQAQIIQKHGNFNWDISLNDWGNSGIHGKDCSVDMGKRGNSETAIIFQHDVLSYLKYLVFNDIGKNITGN